MGSDGLGAAFYFLTLIFRMATHHTVRALRRRFALNQKELAGLLGLSQSAVSRLESRGEPATLETTLALQVIFGEQPKLLFHERYASVEDAVMRRAAELDRKLRGKTDPASLKKLELLEGMVKRAQPVASQA